MADIHGPVRRTLTALPIRLHVALEGRTFAVGRCDEEVQVQELEARPYPFPFDASRAALVVIDMQRDFLEPGGFGEALGNDVRELARVIEPIGRVLAAARVAGLTVVHTREGHLPDLSDLPAAKRARGRGPLRIGDPGPMGRILVRGEPGHAIIPQLAPLPGELVIDKPGKGAFYRTDLDARLRESGVQQLIVCGVTTEVCVNTTVREANDRGYDCLVLEDGTASYFPQFHAMALKMLEAQDGIVGWVGRSSALLPLLQAERRDSRA